MRKLSILVVLALLCFGSAFFSSKAKKTVEHKKEQAQDILEITKERAQAARDFMSGKAHETKADAHEALHEAKSDAHEALHGTKEAASSSTASDMSQSSLDSIKEKAQAAKDFASSKFHEIKADATEAFHSGKDSVKESQSTSDAIKEKAQAAKDFASSKLHEIKADATEAFHSGKESVQEVADKVGEGSKNAFERATGTSEAQLSQSRTPNKDFAATGEEFKQSSKPGKMSKDTTPGNLRTGVSSITLVLLSLIIGVLFFVSFGSSASVDTMKGKFFEARGKAKGALDSATDRAKASYYDAKVKARENANREH
jgi:F0F1-type ATP synthase membrane subunit b/b'